MSLGLGLEVSEAQARPRVSLCPPAALTDPDLELSAPSPASCLPMCHHASCHTDNGLNLKL